MRIKEYKSKRQVSVGVKEDKNVKYRNKICKKDI